MNQESEGQINWKSHHKNAIHFCVEVNDAYLQSQILCLTSHGFVERRLSEKEFLFERVIAILVLVGDLRTKVCVCTCCDYN